jgi:hypothetical protein
MHTTYLFAWMITLGQHTMMTFVCCMHVMVQCEGYAGHGAQGAARDAQWIP